MYESIGYSAIGLGSVCLIPQIYQMLKTKKVTDINIYFLFISLLSDFLYILYGILDKNTIMAISGIPPTISHTIVTILWFYYQNLLYCKFKINNDEKSDNLSRSQD